MIAALQAKAQSGDPNAEMHLSFDYYRGSGVVMDFNKAFDLALESAIQDNDVAAKNLAVFYDQGKGVHRNELKATEWYLRAAELGSSEAQRVMGVRYEEGIATPKNEGEAMRWLRAAALQGDSEAQALYGKNLVEGYDGKKNSDQGFAYLLSSNYPYAGYLIAKCYEQGVCVARDPVRAYAWLLLAPQNNKDVIALMPTLKKELTPGQISQATAYSSHLAKEHKTYQFESPDMTTIFSAGTSVTLKFKKVLGLIVVPVTLQNKEQVNFVIDTGCSISMIDARLASRFGLVGTEPLDAHGIGADILLASLADNVSLGVPGLKIDGARVALLPHFDLDEIMGLPVTGFIGSDILKHFVVRIDYDKKLITLAKPGTLAEDPKAASIPLDLERNTPFIPADIGDPATGMASGKFFIDTGDDGTFSLTRTFQQNHPDIRIDKSVQSGSLGIGGIEMGAVSRVPLALGGLRLNDSYAYLDQQSDGMAAGLDGGDIGARIWDRFQVTLDFPGKKLFLTPAADFKKPFDYTNGAPGIKALRPDYHTFQVFAIVPNGPAESVDLRVGDQITQIDQQPTQAMSLDQVDDVLKKDGIYKLQIHRAGHDFTVELPVYDPFKHPGQIAKYISSAPDPYYPKIGSMIVHWRGSAFYPDAVIDRASGLKVGDLYTPFAMRRAVKKLYATGLFRYVDLTAPLTQGTTPVTLELQPYPLIKTIVLTGLQPQEEADLRPRLISEVGKLTSHYDLFRDVALIRDVLGKGNAVDRTVSIDLIGEDGSKEHREIVIPKAGAGA